MKALKDVLKLPILVIVTVILMTGADVVRIYGAQGGSNPDASVSSILEKYALSSIDTQIDGLNFEELVQNIISDGVTVSLPKLWSRLVNAAVSGLKANVAGICQILIIAIFTAVFTNFASVFADTSISDTGKKLSRIAAVTVMVSVYTCTAGIARDVLSGVTSFIKMLMPAYISCIALCSGNFSAAAFSEGVMLAVLVINYVFSNIVITGGSIYVMIKAADAITGGGLDKMAELVMTALKWIIKSAMAAVIGINIIQGMVAPMADGVNRGVLTRAVSLIPGIGGGVSALSSVLLGAGALIKNGMGAAALIVIVTICAVPVAKLAMFTAAYRCVGAFTQPVCGKEFAEMITGFAEAMKLMLSLVVSSLATVFIVIAVICISTSPSGNGV